MNRRGALLEPNSGDRYVQVLGAEWSLGDVARQDAKDSFGAPLYLYLLLRLIEPPPSLVVQATQSTQCFAAQTIELSRRPFLAPVTDSS